MAVGDFKNVKKEVKGISKYPCGKLILIKIILKKKMESLYGPEDKINSK